MAIVGVVFRWNTTPKLYMGIWLNCDKRICFCIQQFKGNKTLFGMREFCKVNILTVNITHDIME